MRLGLIKCRRITKINVFLLGMTKWASPTHFGPSRILARKV